LTETGLTLGSPLYMAPEQVTGSAEVDGRADVYALGCVLFEMLTGRAPFEGATVEAVLGQHLTRTPPLVGSLRREAPLVLEELVARALAKAPGERFPGAAEMERALREASMRQGVARRRRWPPLRAAVAAIALALLAVAGFVWSRPSLLAYSELRQGKSALAAWRLASAERHLSAALRLKPGYPEAALWLAQTRVWSGAPTSDWRPLIEGAMTAGPSLPATDRGVGDPLLLLARKDFPAACAEYERMRAADSASFVAWLGLGDCRAHDSAVLRDPSSPSGYRFRSSYQQAVPAYLRAFRLLPGLPDASADEGLSRIRTILQTRMRRLRAGLGTPPDTGLFLSYPSWEGDSLAFISYRAGEVYAAAAHTRPGSYTLAVRRQRELLHGLAADWVRASPGSPGALEALSVSLELLGDPAAVGAVHRARSLATDPEQRIRLATMETWQRVKFASPGDTAALQAARILADSTLRLAAGSTGPSAGVVAGIAALGGHVYAAASLARIASPSQDFGSQRWPSTLARPAGALLAYAAFGAPLDSITTLAAYLETAIRNNLDAGDRETARYALLGRPASLAFPLRITRGDLTEEGDYVLDAQRAFGRGDTASIDAIFDRLRSLRRSDPPAELSFDGLYPEARLLQAIAEPREAIAWLDPTLADLAWTEPEVIADVAVAATFVRTLALRAELAAQVGDAVTAARWARAVLVLWSGADPPLSPVVERMRQLAAGR
jgi:tetratricopeptide (TPR) repeat protein